MDYPDYILKNHIDSDTDFRLELWASEPHNISARTTNGPENVHMHFNSTIYTSHSHIRQTKLYEKNMKIIYSA